jgi:hypothetical protein
MVHAFYILVILAVILGLLVWRTTHPYRVSPEQMADRLRRVLDGKMPSEEWHQFIHRRISRHPYLDSVRLRLLELPLKAYRDDETLYRTGEIQKISAILDELRKKTA